MRTPQSPLPRIKERGAALVVTTTLSLVMIGFGLTVMTAVESACEEHGTSKAQLQRLAIAEAGLRSGVMNLSMGGNGEVGTAMAPLDFGGGQLWVTCADNGDGTYTLTSRATYLGGRRALQAHVRESGNVFNHAIFAGNSSGDLNYELDLGGFGDEADQIGGNVYSGNNINVWGDANVQGTLRAGGTIAGAAGEEGTTQPGFDFSGMDYANMADVDVAGEFSAHGYSASDDAGGTAMQVPEAIDSHIFRKNPDDRSSEVSGTTKDDYFLEDPYEVIGQGNEADGSDAYAISLTGTGTASNYRKVFYIDGNLWLHNLQTLSMKFPSVGADGTQVTFVVKGNVYFSDNLILDDVQQDGVAFIALKDDAVSDSGNIYFGDARYGTLQRMHAFMYAEENFFDNALDANTTSSVEVMGTMAAGNHVSISRTFESGHSRLSVTPDTRIDSGTLSLPGIPQQTQSLNYEVLAWIEINPDS